MATKWFTTIPTLTRSANSVWAALKQYESQKKAIEEKRKTAEDYMRETRTMLGQQAAERMRSEAITSGRMLPGGKYGPAITEPFEHQERERDLRAKAIAEVSGEIEGMNPNEAELIIQQELNYLRGEQAEKAGGYAGKTADWYYQLSRWIASNKMLPPFPISAEEGAKLPSSWGGLPGWKSEEVEALKASQAKQKTGKAVEAMEALPGYYSPEAIEKQYGEYGQVAGAEKPWWESKRGQFQHGVEQIHEAVDVPTNLYVYYTVVNKAVMKGGKLKPADQAFYEEYQKQKGDRAWPVTKPSKELVALYEKAAPTSVKVLQTITEPTTAPLWALPGGAASRTALAGRAAKLAQVGTKAAKAEVIGIKVARGALLPVEAVERVITLPFEGAAKAIQGRRIALKWNKLDKAFRGEVEPILKKVDDGVPLIEADYAKLTAFDDTYSKALKDMAARTEAKARPVEVAPKPVAEVKPPAAKAPVTPEVVGKSTEAIPKAKVTPVAAKAVKEPWQMTREEFNRTAETDWFKGKKWIAKDKQLTNMREEVVKDAVSEGKPVPEAVLKDYPDLAKAVPEAEIGKGIAPEAEVTKAPKIESVVDEVRATTGITPEQQARVGERPAGGEAYEFYNKLFDVEDSADILKRLYPKGYEQRAAKLLGKAKLGGAVKLINPSLTPRATMEATRVQEAAVIWADTTTRRSQGMSALVGDMLRDVLPEKDALKHFKIKNGIQTAFSPKSGYEKASTAIVDVMEHPYKWELDDAALKFSELWRRTLASSVKKLEQEGIKVNKAFYEEGAGYFPRLVKEAHGEPVKVVRARFEKPRSYASQIDAIENNVVYTEDPVQNVQAFVEHTHELIANKRFQDMVNPIGRTAKDVMPMDLVVAKEEGREKVKNLMYALNAVRRAKRGELLPAQTTAALERKAPEVVATAKSLPNLLGKERGEAATKVIKELQGKLAGARAESLKASREYAKAMEVARSPRLGEFEKSTKHFLFRNRVFPEEVAKVLDDFAVSKPHAFWRATQSVSSTLRLIVAALDFSPMFIQGVPMLGRMPHKWARTTLRAFDVLFTPKNAVKLASTPERLALRARHPDIVQGKPFEYFEALEKLGKAKIVGRGISKVYSPFERFFTMWGNEARLTLAESLESTFVRAGKGEQLGTFVNRMTGVMESRAIGVGTTQRAIETGWVFFAPRYTRACAAYIGNLFKTGVVGKEAWKSVGGLAAGGMTFYIGVCKGLGQEPHLDPRYPTFMTVKIGGRDMGIGGFYYSFLRFGTDVYTSIVGDGPDKRQDFTSLSRKDNPFIKFLYSRTAPLTGLLTQAIDRADYFGDPLQTPQDWAHWLFVEHMMPIAMQSAITKPTETVEYEKLPTLAAEMLGLRTFPADPYYELRDKYAQQIYGQDWDELWKYDSEGEWVGLSRQQERLLDRHPDLREAYEKYRVRNAERWKHAHGLLD